MFEQAYFQNDDAAREHLEAIRWPEGAVCPHCGCIGNTTKMNVKRRAGLYKCNDCRKQFTVTVGTVFEPVAHPAPHVVSGRLPSLLVQEGHEFAPDAPHARSDL